MSREKGATKRRRPCFDQLYEALYIWFCENRRKGFPVSGTIIKAKALQLNERLGGSKDFSASEGWLSLWKQRYGIRQLTICGEQLSANREASDDFVKEFTRKVIEEGWTKSQIFNADEAGLNFRLFPNKTLADKTERVAPGLKKNKDRLTVMACSNADGSFKLPLLVIGKSAKPRAFKNLSRDLLPVYYTHQKKAWMDRTIFQTWFTEQFVPLVTAFLIERGLPLKAVLLLDNAPSHPPAETLSVGEIKVSFLPPNVTALIQPMDQGILENLKSRYRYLLLSSMLNDQENGAEVTSLLKSINVKDVIYWLSDAWDALTTNTARKCWKKIFPEILDASEVNVSQEQPISEQLLSVLCRINGNEGITAEEAQNWTVGIDDIVHSDADIIEIVTSSNDDEEIVSDGEAQAVSISAEEAFKALEVAVEYFEQNEHLVASDLNLLRKIKEKALSLNIMNISQ